MKRGLLTAILTGAALWVCSAAYAGTHPFMHAGLRFEADTVAVARDTVSEKDNARTRRDSVRRARNEAAKEEMKNVVEGAVEDIKDLGKEVGQEIKDAALDVKDAALDLKDQVVEQYNETKEKLKESFRETKEQVGSWFNENIKANTVGDFDEIQRQNNHDFSVMVGKPWDEYALQVYPSSPVLEGALFNSKSQIKGEAESTGTTTLSADRRYRAQEGITAPVPELYFRGAAEEAVSQSITKQYISYKFYGSQIRIYYNSSLRATTLGKGKEKNVAKFWEYLSQEDFNPVLVQLYDYKVKLGLNDLLYARLVQTFADKLFEKSKNGENLGFTVFMLNQTGYDARLARLKGEKIDMTAVLFPLYEKAYDLPFVTIGSHEYYLLSPKLGKKEMGTAVYCYPKALATATHPFSLEINPSALALAPLYGQFKGYIYNERLADIEASMPSGPVYLTAEAPFSELMQKTLQYRFKLDLDSLVQKKQDADLRHTLSVREKQEIQLMALSDFLSSNITSQAKQSSKLNGKTLYPDAMFFKKGSGDVRDRSLLYAQICNRILGIPAIVLMYDDYAVPAVQLDSSAPAEGSFFEKAEKVEYDGRTWYLCGRRPKGAPALTEAEIYVW